MLTHSLLREMEGFKFLPEVHAFQEHNCRILSSFKIVIIFNITSADVILKMTIILNPMKIVQLCSKNGRTLLHEKGFGIGNRNQGPILVCVLVMKLFKFILKISSFVMYSHFLRV